MNSLFRYMSPKHADAFVDQGAILFHALSYFRDYEDAAVRADEFEGTRVHLPLGGLKVTKVASGEVVPLPHAFESTAREDDIFICCLSTTYSEELAEKFGTKTCVEIFEPGKFVGLIRSALARRPSIKNKHLEFGPVKYYAMHDPVIVDWALPERIALSKPSKYSWQDEYRIAFAENDAFKVENTELKLVVPGTRPDRRSENHPQRLFKLGRVSKICKIHRF